MPNKSTIIGNIPTIWNNNNQERDDVKSQATTTVWNWGPVKFSVTEDLAINVSVVSAGYLISTLTTTIYPIEEIENLSILTSNAIRTKQYSNPTDFLGINASILLSGILATPYHEYSMVPEGLDINVSQVVSGVLHQVLLSYSDWPAEDVQINVSTILSGSLDTVLITYTNWPAEDLQINTSTVISGTLS